MTGTARKGSFSLGMDDQSVVDAIQSLTTSDFYKSMPSEKKPLSPYHDVYKFDWSNKKIYAKFQDFGGLLVVSFKEK